MATVSPYAQREVTKPPDWHELVVWDFLFNGVTTGLFLVAAVADLARPAVFGPVAAWAYPVALGVLAVDLVCLVFDLGHPTRFHHMLRVVKPSSPMSLGTWCLTAYSLPLTLAAAFTLLPAAGLLAGDWSGWRRAAVAVGLPPALGALGYKGVLFSTSSQPGWRDARWLGGYHAATAVALGAATLLVIAGIVGAGEAVEPLRIAVALTALVGGLALGLLVPELAPAVRRRYPGWVLTALGLLVVGALVPAGLAAVGAGWADAAALAVTAASAWAVRAVVVRLPQPAH